MNRLLSTCVAIIAGTLMLSAAGAQSSTPAGSSTAAPDQTMPPSQSTPSQPTTTSPTDQQMAPSSPSTGAQSSDLTGQTIYNSRGRKIGTVASMTTDSKGQQAAVVNVERRMGMGGREVLIPVSDLQQRTSGSGYSTTLTTRELRKLPAYSGSSGTSQ
ncbi:MAG: PRC-barrel domain-containing protein [Alphaproteobacteria bacterium]|nr:PRC-barrel domain-containing protein [Alphaproteobacteria bacterium]